MLNAEIRYKRGHLIGTKTLREFDKETNPPRGLIFEDPKICFDNFQEFTNFATGKTDNHSRSSKFPFFASENALLV
jgi:hypothetical protein